MIDFIFYFQIGLGIGMLLELVIYGLGRVIQYVLVCLRRAKDMSDFDEYAVVWCRDESDIKTAATCLDCDYYRECDVFCYYNGPEDSDDEETEV